MSIEWLLTKVQRSDVQKGTAQSTADVPAAENEVDGLSPIHFRCRCGYEGKLSRGETETQLSAKGNSEVVCFECANCGRHLQYDCLSGTVRIKKGIMRAFLDMFS